MSWSHEDSLGTSVQVWPGGSKAPLLCWGMAQNPCPHCSWTGEGALSQGRHGNVYRAHLGKSRQTPGALGGGPVSGVEGTEAPTPLLSPRPPGGPGLQCSGDGPGRAGR